MIHSELPPVPVEPLYKTPKGRSLFSSCSKATDHRGRKHWAS